ncbi:uncharacterized protein LOC120779411 [Bactrocera tryoni]|uniref:uncharacterized protein LOC120779411 n=1 Tax=Bactrocera tryoni TaxID=59916 RepID=UPI001A95FC6A|nr:uncharacterized protein LOC120779411 [Bactrocera tryoni]
MKSQRFMSNYKCECYGHTFCNCPDKTMQSSIFMENVYDVAETLAQIMVICGIHQAKAKAAIDVIIYSFIHYDEIRHRIDTVPRKRLCKEDLIHDLGRKCLMSRMEAQLTYSIIKRAFKAFYHGTSEGGIRNPMLEAQMVHSQECLWVHAAKRTAQIYASYEGMFFTAQKNYESLIKCVYKKLYDRMQSRSSPLVLSDCSCTGCVQRTVVELPKPSKSMYSIHGPINEEDSTNLRVLPVVSGSDLDQTCDVKGYVSTKGLRTDDGTASSTSVNLPRCYKCNCPRLICDCDVELETGVVNVECGQGPYKCQWVRMDENDEVLKKPCLELPEEHECPIDCDGESAICDPECECDCESCECQPEESSDYDEPETVDEKAEEEEQFSIEPTSSIQCNTSGHGLPGEYDDCRVPIAHVVEEEAEQPTTIATVVEHKNEGSLTSTEVAEDVENETVEINKLLGTMI